LENQISGYRLSPQQARLWLLGQRSSAYRAQIAIRLEGASNPHALKAALQAIVDGHGILRTTYHRSPGIRLPVQVVNDEPRFAWREIDLTGSVLDLDANGDLSQSIAAIDEILREEAGEPFDYKTGPVIRCCLVSLAAQERVLTISLPSLCADAHTLGNLFREIGNRYGAESASRYGANSNDESSEENIVDYLQFSEWQNELLEDESGKVGREYWTRQKTANPVTPRLPFETTPSLRAAFEPASISTLIDDDSVRSIESAARNNGCSKPVFLLACFQTLLWRLTAQSNITTAYLVDGRKYDELRDAMGLFAKWAPIRCTFEANQSFSQVIGAIQEATGEAYDWQEYLIPEQSGMTALADSDAGIGFEFEEAPSPITKGGVSFSVLARRDCFEPHKLMLSCLAGDGSLATEFQYDPELFRRADIERLAEQFKALMKHAAKAPNALVSELDVLGEIERRRLLVEFNSTAAEYPEDKCIHHLFEEEADRTPDGIAVVMGNGQLSFAQLNSRANQLAHHLSRQGFGSDAIVSLFLDRSPDMVVAILGVLKSGASYLPLNAAHPGERLAFILDDARPAVVIAQERLANALPANSPATIYIDSDWEAISTEAQTNLSAQVHPDNLAYVIYTSGSTGRPKGVMITHRGVVNYLSWSIAEYAVATGNGSLVHSPLVFDLTVTSLFAPLLTGKPITLLPEDAGVESLSEALRAQRDLSLLKITPAHLETLNAFLPPAEAAGRTNVLVIGGEALFGKSLSLWRTHSAKTRLINEYGPTEAVVGSCAYEVPADAAFTDAVPIGRPIANTRLYLFDPRLEPVPAAVPGELYIGGDGLARAYLNRADLTAEKFVPNPFGASGERLYRTGDLARHLHTGIIEYLGRSDHQVKIRGFRIELGEIEAVLSQHPSIKEAVVSAREEGADHKRLVAYVVPDQRANLTTDQLRNYLGAKLPEYMIPSFFVILRSLPLTSNGKVDRAALPPPSYGDSGSDDGYVAPRNEIEETLASIWSTVLAIGRVGIHDNFFKLGGDSIISIQIIARANQAGIHLTPKQFFEHQTIAELAAVAESAPFITSFQGTVTGPVPLTPIQHWFFEQRIPDPHHFNQSLMLELKERLDPEVLSRVVDILLEHHDALRMRFHLEGESWIQENSASESNTPFTLIELGQLPESVKRAAIEQAASQAQSSLDLNDGPLMRVVLIDLGESAAARLLLASHHLVVDGVSWRVLLEDLNRAYENLSQGKEASLGPKTTSFKDWAESLVEYARSEEMKEDSRYWSERSRARVARAPADYLGGRNLVNSGRVTTVSLSEQETRTLLTSVGNAYRTQIQEVLLCAVAEALSQWTGGERVKIEMEGHGREEIIEGIELTRTIGWFTSVYPLVLDVKRGGLGEKLKSVKEQMRSVPRRGIGYGILRYLSPDDSVSSLLKQQGDSEVVFNYLGRLDEVLNETVFAPAAELPGPNRSLAGARRYLIDISASVTEGRLHLHWTYSTNLHRPETINKLAGRCIQALKELIEHATSEEAGGYTPSDFPLAQLNQTDLDRALLEVELEG